MADVETHATVHGYRFGTFEVSRRPAGLRRNGRAVRIDSKPLELLLCLLDRPGELVTREDLQRRLWGESLTPGGDHRLDAAMNRLRVALHDSGTNPRFVQTLPRRGYRTIAPVVTLLRDEPRAEAVTPSTREASPAQPTRDVAAGSAAGGGLPRWMRAIVRLSGR